MKNSFFGHLNVHVSVVFPSSLGIRESHYGTLTPPSPSKRERGLGDARESFYSRRWLCHMNILRASPQIIPIMTRADVP